MRTGRHHHPDVAERRTDPRRRAGPAELARAWLVAEQAPAASALLVQGQCRGLRVLQSHPGEGSARTAQRRQHLAQLFQVHLRAQSVGPAGVSLSFPLSPHRQSPAVLELPASEATRLDQQLRDLFDRRRPMRRFRRQVRKPRRRLPQGPETNRPRFDPELPAPRRTSDAARNIIAIITTTRPAGSSATGMRRKSACSLTSSSAP